MRKKLPWVHSSTKRSEPEVPYMTPVRFGDWSNGEIWFPKTRRLAKMEKEVLRRCDEQARRLGMDRRDFISSSAGIATCMAVVNMAGCSSGDDETVQQGGGGGMGGGGGGAAGAGGSSSGSGGSSSGGDRGFCGEPDGEAYVVPPEATCEPSTFLQGNEFIFDIQTHAFNEGEWRDKNSAIVDFIRNSIYPSRAGLAGVTGPACLEPEVLDCYNQNYYGDLMFVESDTTMAVITSWPANTCSEEKYIGCGLPLSNDGMRELRNWINNRALSQRVVNQIQVMPNDVWPLQKEIMTMAFEDPDFRAVSWKCYPAWKSDSYKPEGLPSGYFLDDDIGAAFIQHGLDLCVPNFAIHKGLSIPGFDIEHNQTIDVGPAAAMFPNANLIIYHSGINAGCGATEGLGGIGAGECTENVPYDPTDPAPLGLNQLIRSLEENGIGPNQNVYAELGTAWGTVMLANDTAQHFMGKLLTYIGEDNIVWGTDSILVGSPQIQIDFFRAFTISQQFQDLYGYPPITDEIKAKIFGLNAARIFRIDVDAARCNADSSMFAQHKRYMDEEWGPQRYTVRPGVGPRSASEYLGNARMAVARGEPA